MSAGLDVLEIHIKGLSAGARISLAMGRAPRVSERLMKPLMIPTSSSPISLADLEPHGPVTALNVTKAGPPVPWLKQGDAAANHPIVLAAVEMEDADDRILNECFGFVGRCATQAAAYEQDYIITVGTAKHMAGSIARYNA
jgi:hypothetical protein